MTSNAPLQTGGEMFARAKTPSLIPPRSQSARPASAATEILETDFEDDESEFEEYSAKSSFDSVRKLWQTSFKHA